MTDHQQQAVDDLARALAPAEAELEDAIVANSRLTCTAIETRRSLGLHPSVGHVAIKQLLEAKQDIVAGLSKTLHVHKLLDSMAEKLNIVVAYGGTLKDQEEAMWAAVTGSGRQALTRTQHETSSLSPTLTVAAA